MNNPVDLLGLGMTRGDRGIEDEGVGWKRYKLGQSTVKSEWSVCVPHQSSLIVSVGGFAGREEE